MSVKVQRGGLRRKGKSSPGLKWLRGELWQTALVGSLRLIVFDRTKNGWWTWTLHGAELSRREGGARSEGAAKARVVGAARRATCLQAKALGMEQKRCR